MKLRSLLEDIKNPLNEGATDIRKVNTDVLATNARDVLNAFVNEGFRGVYDPEKGVGKVVGPNGIHIELSTGDENLYLKIDEVYTKEQPIKTIKKLKEFLEFVSNNQ